MVRRAVAHVDKATGRHISTGPDVATVSTVDTLQKEAHAMTHVARLLIMSERQIDAVQFFEWKARLGR